MEQLNNEQTEVSFQAVEQPVNTEEKEEKVSLGKFKDVNALLNAYNSLQAEFTKRCQRIKELESMAEVADKNIPAPNVQSESSEKEERDTNLEEKVIKEYFKDLFVRRRGAIVMDGEGLGLRTPVKKPKTVQDAGELAKELLVKK